MPVKAIANTNAARFARRYVRFEKRLRSIRLRKIDGYKKLAGLISEQMRRAA